MLLTSSLGHKLTYYIQTIPDIKQYLVKVDEEIDNGVIPSNTEGHGCTADERLLLSLHVKKGGLAIPISNICDLEYSNSWLLVSRIAA